MAERVVGEVAAEWAAWARSVVDARPGAFRDEWVRGGPYHVLPFHGHLASLAEFLEPNVVTRVGSVGERLVFIDASWIDLHDESASDWSTGGDGVRPSVWSSPAILESLCWCVDEMPFNSWIAASTSRDSVLLSSRWEHFALATPVGTFDAAVVRGVREQFVRDVRSLSCADGFDAVLEAYGLG